MQVLEQDAIIVEALWAPLRKMGKDGKLHIINDRSIKNSKDLEKVVPPEQEDIDVKINFIRDYIQATKGTNTGVTLLTGCFFQTYYQSPFSFE